MLILGLLFGFCGTAASIAPTVEPRSLGERLFIAVIFSLLALSLLYPGLVLLLNRIQVRADRMHVVRTCGPIWCMKRIDISALGIKQFFAVSVPTVRTSQSSSAGTIYVIDAQEHVRTLATSLPSSFAANQICHELEDFYGIEDLPVYGVTTDPAHPGPRTG